MGLHPALVFIPLAAAAIYAIGIHNLDLIQELQRLGLKQKTHDGVSLATLRFGPQQVGDQIKGLIAFFWPLVKDKKHPASSLWLYFILTYMPVAWSVYVEAGRMSNQGTILNYPNIWAQLCQFLTGGVVNPIFALFGSLHLRSTSHSPVYRSNMAAVLTSFIFGFILPTVLTFNPLGVLREEMHLFAIGLFQIFPFIVHTVISVLGPLLPRIDDNNSVNSGYFITLAIAGFTHLLLALRVLGAEKQTAEFAKIFLPDPFLKNADFAHKVHVFLAADYIFAFSSMLIYSFYAVPNSIDSFLKRLLLAVQAGPGFATGLAFYRREQAIQRPTTRRQGDVKKRA